MNDHRHPLSPVLDHCPPTLPAHAYFDADWHAREMAMLSRDTYESHGAPLGCKRLSDNPKALPGDLKDFPFRDPSSGFDASLYEMQDGRIVIAYRGTEGHGDLVADVKQAFGFHSEQYDRAVELANLVKDQYPDKVIELTGHSLGGGLAAIASSTTGLPATTFNAASLHDRTLKRYGALPATEVTNYRLAGDPLSGVQDQSALSGGLAGLSTGSLTVAVIGGLIGSLPSAQGKQVDVPAVDSDGNTLSMNPKIRHSVNSFDGAFANQIKLETTAEDWRIP